MKSLLLPCWLLSATLFLVFAVLTSAVDRASCQKSSKEDPIKVCPPNTVIVGRTGKFQTIQSAVQSIPKDNTPYTILIQPGTYREQVNITRPGPLTLLGSTSNPNTHTSNTVTIIWKASEGSGGKGGDNAFTSTLTVAPNLDAALTGAGPTGHAVSKATPFGNTDFRAYNINFSNEGHSGPSLAVSISYANAGFYFCSTKSFQDTVYVGKIGSALFHGGEVAGETDFFYGFGTAWVQSAIVSLRGCGGGITAWKGTETTFPNKYGVYVHDSQVKKAGSVKSGGCALGRPWNALHRSIFAKTHLDDSIRTEGYIKWSGNDGHISGKTFMAEYANTGPGFNKAGRSKGPGKVLSDAEYEPYSTMEKVFQFMNGTYGNVRWIDRNPGGFVAGDTE
ncbi:pectin methylesterase [Tothia fuscella]|uniref:pectinesterase n=1 Tax=Tothia fuscella TaxID=1048955 RepID=A0A9P4NWC1_9PEZI|nr:pectin methylesterase [Tothia fuscella]